MSGGISISGQFIISLVLSKGVKPRQKPVSCRRLVSTSRSSPFILGTDRLPVRVRAGEVGGTPGGNTSKDVNKLTL